MWLEFDSLVNARDVGGLPTTDGGAIRSGRLLRSDNLQDLTDDDIAALRALGVTDVVDLRSVPEVRSEGPGPISRLDDFQVHEHSLFVEEPGEVSTPTNESGPEPTEAPAAALPWVGKTASVSHDNEVAGHYLSYLADRPDSVLAALRVIGTSPGATLVHCAAGKDRTGTVVALALLLAGAEPDAVVADYAASSERIQRIVDRLTATRTYAENLSGRPLSSHLTPPKTMAAFIAHVHDEYGGVPALLAAHGWTDADSEAVRARLRD